MTTIHGFELIQEQEIPELNSRARLFRHVKTGAELLSIENEDENKVFGITFRTPPPDSTGVPHIMEHSVLCGSQKYPLKDPFIQLAKGSLNTFLNAFTFPDKTCYPVASQNLQDFYNLIDVYVDAVFYPLIPPETLQQEGWHYDLENIESPLAIKGVVYNEMKGNYSSPDNLLARLSQQSLFQGHTYGYDSGGDPAVIPDLTYEKFKNFHDTYYHPSNARIFFYGGDDPDERLRRMDEYLKDFEPIKVDSAIPAYPGFDQQRELAVPYDASQETEAGPSVNRGLLTVNWLFPPVQDPQTVLGLQILGYILVGTPASPLRKALIDSGLGEDLTGGLETDLLQMYFSTGLKGIAVANADKVKGLIFQTLASLAQNGIDPDMIGAAVNTTEFSLRENNTGSFPRGLVVMLRALTTWLYDQDPIAPLAFEAPLASIKQRLESGESYFETLIKQYLLDNTSRTTVLLQPDPTLRERENQEEMEHLARIKASFDTDDLLEIIETDRQLKVRQESPDTPEALATLPSLTLEDLDRQIRTIPNSVLNQAGTPILYHDLFTNGIVYLELGFNLHNLPQEYLPYISLFGQALVEIGTESEDFVKLSQRIGRTTGGISPAKFVSMIRDKDQAAAWLFLRGKATMSQTGDLLAILKDILTSVKLDNQDRFRQMVLEEKASLEAQLAPAGHRVVNSRLRSLFNEAGWASEQMDGISFLFFVRKLAESVENNWPAVLEKLEKIRSILVNRSSMLCNVTLDEANWTKFQPQLNDFLESIPSGQSVVARWTPVPKAGHEGLVIPAQVNFVGEGANLYELGYELNGSILVIDNFISTSWLYDRIRLQGGAYGAFCLFDQRSGVYTYLSYRDPNVMATLDTYNQTGKYLQQLDGNLLTSEELTKNIIGVIGDLDTYQLPDAKGFTAMQRYLVGDTDERRQALRDQVFATTLADFHALGEILERMKDEARVVILGSKDAILAVNETRPGWRPGWLNVQRIL